MTIFISYCHEDLKFVDDLALRLIDYKKHLWIDRWELSVGDSMIAKIQGALEKATAIIVVLSQKSVNSEWCKKELSSGLLRELEEKKIIVLPLLLENCNIPIFLRDKIYADFRNDFSVGFKDILFGLEKVTNINQGRLEDAEYYVDWAIDNFYHNNQINLRITWIQIVKNYRYTTLTELVIGGNESVSKWYKKYSSCKLEYLADLIIMTTVLSQFSDVVFDLPNHIPQEKIINHGDTKSDKVYTTKISCRWIGENFGQAVRVSVKGLIEMIFDYLQKTTRKLTEKESEQLFQTLREN